MVQGTSEYRVEEFLEFFLSSKSARLQKICNTLYCGAKNHFNQFWKNNEIILNNNKFK